ncbi:MAG: YraN family protein [Bacteroidales bacterium]|nr:YraN family protein [Bacteroidales bacterium]
MAESHKLGIRGEDLAADYLAGKGYNILFRNWKWRKHEIDIIAENRSFIVFAEVKTRSSDFSLHPSESVTGEKQRSIISAADGYIRKFNLLKESRFDVISVISNNSGFDIEHIEAAFYPTLQ